MLFNFTCPGLSGSTASQLELMRGEASSPFREICREKIVRILYDPDYGWFEVKNGSLLDLTDQMAWYQIHPPAMISEILESFLSFFNLTAILTEDKPNKLNKVSHCCKLLQ